MRLLALTTFALSFIMIIPTKAHACLGSMMETQTFLAALPRDAGQQDLVAKVLIIRTEEGGKAMVKVQEVTQGTEIGAEFTVMYETHSCARDYNVKIGDMYYIAGALDENNVFRGPWKGLDNNPYWPLSIQ